MRHRHGMNRELRARANHMRREAIRRAREQDRAIGDALDCLWQDYNYPERGHRVHAFLCLRQAVNSGN